jgi:uncharacterized protein (DUF934 family)
MPRLIKDGAVVEDSWQFSDSRSEVESALDLESPCFLSLELWLEMFPTGEIPEGASLGVVLEPGQEPGIIADTLASIGAIAIEFPAFADGRGFSYARELRQTHDYEGEIRAIGDILRDQLHYLMRSGFNAFQLSDENDLDGALRSLTDFSEAYQMSIDKPEPLFRRRTS